ncbi:MAG: hypothetical protein ACXWU0_02505, partial [Rhodoplanes sp.]
MFYPSVDSILLQSPRHRGRLSRRAQHGSQAASSPVSAQFDFKSDIDNHSAVGRKRINEEQMPARFPAGTLARIDAVLWSGEKRADLI